MKHQLVAQTIIDRSVAIPFAGCWVWTKGMNNSGYGSVRINGEPFGAHRASYMIFKGDIPQSMDVHHVCENKACVNPEHLELLTRSENVKATPRSRERKTECVNGHALVFENVYDWHGNRGCRTCRRDAWKRYREKQ